MFLNIRKHCFSVNIRTFKITTNFHWLLATLFVRVMPQSCIFSNIAYDLFCEMDVNKNHVHK